MGSRYGNEIAARHLALVIASSAVMSYCRAVISAVLSEARRGKENGRNWLAAACGVRWRDDAGSCEILRKSADNSS